MISFGEINTTANQFGVSAETIEKDYMISWILKCLSRSKIKDNFIFYGGTAIKRIFFEEHRFSEDIDLISANSFTLEYISNELACLRYAADAANLNFEIDKNKIFYKKDRLQLYVLYEGISDITGAPKEIRLDFMMGADVCGSIIKKEVIASYSDLGSQSGVLSVMSLETIFANKLGMLFDLTRNEPRDVFDIWFLLKRFDQVHLNTQKIYGFFKEKYGFNLSVGSVMGAINHEALQKNWEIRLAHQVNNLPACNSVIEEVERMLKEKLG